MAWRALRDRTRPPSAAPLGLGVAGRVAVHAGAHLPHGGDELAALGAVRDTLRMAGWRGL